MIRKGLNMARCNIAWLLLPAIVGLAGCVGARQESNCPNVRIGVYDSRAVAIAYCGTPRQNAQIKQMMAEHKQAQAAGDTKRAKELKAQGRAGQKRMHRQGFGTEPVDDILETIKDKMPEIAKQAEVAAIVSKWDDKALAQYKSAQQVDVTDLIVAQFNPGKKQLKWIEDIKTRKPIPNWKLYLLSALE